MKLYSSLRKTANPIKALKNPKNQSKNQEQMCFPLKRTLRPQLNINSFQKVINVNRMIQIPLWFHQLSNLIKVLQVNYKRTALYQNRVEVANDPKIEVRVEMIMTIMDRISNRTQHPKILMRPQVFKIKIKERFNKRERANQLIVHRKQILRSQNQFNTMMILWTNLQLALRHLNQYKVIINSNIIYNKKQLCLNRENKPYRSLIAMSMILNPCL